MGSDLNNGWKCAADKEYNSLMRHDAWSLCELPPSSNVVDSLGVSHEN